jgi:hypothetical protein
MTEHEISLIKHTVNERFFNDKWKRNLILSVLKILKNILITPVIVYPFKIIKINDEWTTCLQFISNYLIY